MSAVKGISLLTKTLFKNYKGAKLNLQLPSKALVDIGNRNTGKIAETVRAIGTRYPKGTVNIASEIGDSFVRSNITMQQGSKLIGEMTYTADAGLVDTILRALKGGKVKEVTKEFVAKEFPKTLNPTKQVSDKFIKEAFKKTIV